VQKKLSVMLSGSLHLEAKRYCLEHDITLTDLISRLLRGFLRGDFQLPDKQD